MWDYDYYYFETIQDNYGIKKGLWEKFWEMQWVWRRWSPWFSLTLWRNSPTPKSSFCRTGFSHKLTSWEEISGHKKTASTAGGNTVKLPDLLEINPPAVLFAHTNKPRVLTTHREGMRWRSLECSVLKQPRRCKRCKPAGRTRRWQRGNTKRTTWKLWNHVKWLGPGDRRGPTPCSFGATTTSTESVFFFFFSQSEGKKLGSRGILKRVLNQRGFYSHDKFYCWILADSPRI